MSEEKKDKEDSPTNESEEWFGEEAFPTDEEQLNEESEMFMKLLFKGMFSRRYFTKEGRFQPAILSSNIRKLYSIRTLIDTDDVYLYNEDKGFYEENGDKILREVIKKILGNDYKEHYATAVINDITASTYIRREEFKAPTNLVAVENGILDISENPPKLLSHNPEYYFTNVLPVRYDPEAKCPKFLKFLEEIQPDLNVQAQIQELFGYCLLRSYPHQYIFILIGEGSNGRSTLLSVLRRFLGSRNCSAISLQDLQEKFSLAELYHKLANICPDISSKPIEDSSMLKNLSGGDYVKAERKFKNPFDFENYAKLIFSANKIPYSYDHSYAFYRRPIPILFNQRFGTGSGELPVDKYILEKITTSEELSGVLNWALEGLYRLNEENDFTYRMPVEVTQKYYDRLASPMSAFIQDCLVLTYDENDYIPKDDMYSEYANYCKENKIIPIISKERFGRSFKRYAKDVKSGRRTISEKVVYVWLGCRYK